MDYDTLKARIEQALIDDLAASWAAFRRAHPTARFYLFGLETSAAFEFFAPIAATEEGLSQVVSELLERQPDSAALTAIAARWSVADSPHCREQGNLPRITALASELPSPYELADDDRLGYAEAMADGIAGALARLDAAGAFGTGAQRESLCLAVLTHDEREDRCMEYVSALNPPAVIERTAREFDLRIWATREMERQRWRRIEHPALQPRPAAPPAVPTVIPELQAAF